VPVHRQTLRLNQLYNPIRSGKSNLNPIKTLWKLDIAGHKALVRNHGQENDHLTTQPSKGPAGRISCSTGYIMQV
jgi:hypothetical protein